MIRRRKAVVLLLLVAVVGVGAEVPAWATPFTVDIEAGSSGDTIGTATIERIDDGDGTETLHVTAQVPGGIKESHLCISASEYTSRISPGQCPYSQGSTGTVADYVIDLGGTYVGGPLHIQFHVTTGGDTAYAGWRSGKPFFGDVNVPELEPPTPVPVGPLGLFGLALVLGVVLLGSRRRPLTRR